MNRRPVVLVTGGATGIGAACVEKFITEGWDVVLGYFSDDERDLAARAVSRGAAIPCDVLSVPLDVTDDAACRAAAALARERFGRLDALVSSAGATRVVPAADLGGLAMEDFTQLCAVNTAGPFQIARACAPLLREGAGGAIVIVSSYGALFGTGSSLAYAASKGAANTLTLSLARLLAPEVRVNAVCPALVRGGLADRQDPVRFEERCRSQLARAPLKNIATAQAVASDIYWLAAGTRLMTGSVIMLDSGLHLNGDA